MKRVSDRLAALTAAILLQAVFIALFLQTPHLGAPPRALERELTFILPRLVPVPKQAAAPRAVTPPLMQAPRPPDIISLPPPAAAPPESANVQGLGKSLFGCAPENRDMLTPQDRVRCETLFTPHDDLAVTEPRSRVRDPNRRAAELADRNTPARVPCVGLQTQKLGFQGHETTIAVADPVCVLKGLVNGFHLTALPP